jgi:prepilin-type N-terminal cleavage/methylation domain-containing protein
MKNIRKFTLIELLVVVAIMAILMSLLYPSLQKARRAVKQAVCLSNQSQIARGMQIYSNDNSRAVPLGSTFDYRYSFSLWDKNAYDQANNRKGWMALGLIYENTTLKSLDSWTCPSQPGKGWARASKKSWPPGELKSTFTHSDFMVRATDKSHTWPGYNVPKLPKLDTLNNNMAYTADTFAGFNFYSYRHGLYKKIIFSRIDGSARISQDSKFHTQVMTIPDWNSASSNHKIESLWKRLDAL